MVIGTRVTAHPKHTPSFIGTYMGNWMVKNDDGQVYEVETMEEYPPKPSAYKQEQERKENQALRQEVDLLKIQVKQLEETVARLEIFRRCRV